MQTRPTVCNCVLFQLILDVINRFIQWYIDFPVVLLLCNCSFGTLINSAWFTVCWCFSMQFCGFRTPLIFFLRLPQQRSHKILAKFNGSHSLIFWVVLNVLNFFPKLLWGLNLHLTIQRFKKSWYWREKRCSHCLIFTIHHPLYILISYTTWSTSNKHLIKIMPGCHTFFSIFLFFCLWFFHLNSQECMLLSLGSQTLVPPL